MISSAIYNKFYTPITILVRKYTQKLSIRPDKDNKNSLKVSLQPSNDTRDISKMSRNKAATFVTSRKYRYNHATTFFQPKSVAIKLQRHFHDIKTHRAVQLLTPRFSLLIKIMLHPARQQRFRLRNRALHQFLLLFNRLNLRRKGLLEGERGENNVNVL